MGDRSFVAAKQGIAMPFVAGSGSAGSASTVRRASTWMDSFWSARGRRSHLRRKTMMAVALFLGVAAETSALPLQSSFIDDFTLETSNQSIWSAGGASSFSYDSDLLGARWGTYAGEAPRTTGFSAFTGGRTQITPAIPAIYSPAIPAIYSPAIPAIYTPAIPAVVIPGFTRRVCVFGACVNVNIPPRQITPAIPARLITPAISPRLITPAIPPQLITPAIPALYADTTTGAGVGVESSGEIGVYVKAQADGGALAVALPITATLNIDDTPSGFRVSGSSTLLSGASISATAPSFRAGVDGLINLDTKIAAEGCLALVGCEEFQENLNLNAGRFPIVGFDTLYRDPADGRPKPLSLAGINVPLPGVGSSFAIRAGGLPCQGPVTASGAPPTCPPAPFAPPILAWVEADTLSNASGGAVVGGTMTLNHNDPVFRVTADLPGIGQTILGFPVDVLNPKFTYRVGTTPVVSVEGSIFDAQLGVQLGLSQRFQFTPELQVQLDFDKPVEELVGREWITRNTSVTVNLDDGADLRFAGEAGQLLRRTYGIVDETNFETNWLVSIDPILRFKAGCLGITVVIAPVFKECLYDEEFRTTDLFGVPVYENSFSLGGFSTSSFSSLIADLALDDPAAGGGGGDVGGGGGDVGGGGGGGTVPEPSMFWLMLLATVGLAAARQGRFRMKSSRGRLD